MAKNLSDEVFNAGKEIEAMKRFTLHRIASLHRSCCPALPSSPPHLTGELYYGNSTHSRSPLSQKNTALYLALPIHTSQHYSHSWALPYSHLRLSNKVHNFKVYKYKIYT
jgi:hypothetical protein